MEDTAKARPNLIGVSRQWMEAARARPRRQDWDNDRPFFKRTCAREQRKAAHFLPRGAASAADPRAPGAERSDDDGIAFEEPRDVEQQVDAAASSQRAEQRVRARDGGEARHRSD